MKRIDHWFLAYTILVLAILLTAFLGGLSLSPYLLPSRLPRRPRAHSEIAVEPRWYPLGESRVILEQRFYGTLPSDDVLLRGAVRGMLETLDDPYTVLIDPQPAQEEQRRLAGRYGDVGVSLWWAPDGHVGLSPYPEGPAERAGLQDGDYLLSVNGESITGTLNLGQISWMLQGEVDTTVTLTISRSQQLVMTKTVTREEVLHPSLQWRVLGGELGYVNIIHITDQTALEVRDALDELQQKGTRALILDLRGNGGGVVAPLSDLVGTFLPSQTPIYYEVKHGTEEVVKTKGPQVFDGPLVVLINGGTASAAEIIAGALRDNERAVLVGTPTFGKGSIQALYPLKDGSTLHVTNSIWLTPNRNRLDRAGLEPDILIEPVEGRDAILDAAISYFSAADE